MRRTSDLLGTNITRYDLLCSMQTYRALPNPHTPSIWVQTSERLELIVIAKPKAILLSLWN